MAFNPDLPFTINMPTCFKYVRTLVLRTKPLTVQTFQGLLSYQVVPWSFDWLRNVAVVYEPSGVQQDDDLVVNTICNGILLTITWDHPYQRTRVDKVDDISMLKRITFKWDGHESIERPVLATELSWWTAYRRRDFVTFRKSRIDNSNNDPTGCVWQRCRTWDELEARPRIWVFVRLFAILIIMIAWTIVCLLIATSLIWNLLSTLV
jgi:hypothetical protein